MSIVCIDRGRLSAALALLRARARAVGDQHVNGMRVSGATPRDCMHPARLIASRRVAPADPLAHVLALIDCCVIVLALDVSRAARHDGRLDHRALGRRRIVVQRVERRPERYVRLGRACDAQPLCGTSSDEQRCGHQHDAMRCDEHIARCGAMRCEAHSTVSTMRCAAVRCDADRLRQ